MNFEDCEKDLKDFEMKFEDFEKHLKFEMKFDLLEGSYNFFLQ
jgi:hypothetical protein